MKRVALGLALATVLLASFPRGAAAQCGGGVTLAGYYLRDGGYVPGHCASTNPTTTAQLYPSGAQPVPSTNPALGNTRLPGQLSPGGLLPRTGTDAGLSTGQVAPTDGAQLVTSPGPGAPVSAPTGLTVLPNSAAPSGLVSSPPSSAGTTPPLPLPGTTTGDGDSTQVTPSALLLGSPAAPPTAYYYTLPMAPPPEAGAEGAPPAPGRGGPIYIGEERAGDLTIAVPGR